MSNIITLDNIKLCECGCGESIPIRNKWGKKCKFKFGHQNRGSNNGMFKGRIKQNGYYLIYIPNHHFSSKSKYVLEHRLIYELYHQCSLLPWAVIHHINGVKTDNRIENLMALPDQSFHLRIHRKGNHNPRTKKDISNRSCLSCNSYKTNINNRGSYQWYRHNNNTFLCHKCYKIYIRDMK